MWPRSVYLYLFILEGEPCASLRLRELVAGYTLILVLILILILILILVLILILILILMIKEAGELWSHVQCVHIIPHL